MLGLTSGFVVIRRWSNLDQYLLLDKQGLKHNGSVWAIVPCTAGVVATGGEDGLLNIWRTDKQLFL
jgi:WD40 repeat protein